MKLGILLVLTVISSVFVSHAYADSIFIKFDKPEYHTGDSLSITGKISEFKMPVIAMNVYDVDGKILAANSIEIEPDGLFTKTLFLDSPFYEKPGQYKVKFDYGKISQSEFFIISTQDIPKVRIEEPSIPEIVFLDTDKPQYEDNDTITITGSVSSLDSPTVLIGIYDTFGTPAGFYFGHVTSDLKFSTSFLAKAGVNFKVDGTYSIKAHYAESFKISSFDFVKVIDNSEIIDDPDLPSSESTPSNNENDSEIDNSENESQSDTNDSVQDKSEIKENDTDDNSIVDKPEDKPEDKPLIQNTPQTEEKIRDDEPLSDFKPSNEKPKSEKSSDKIKKQNNLTVEDIELGLILNQINLECDSSKYADTITYYDGMGPALYRLCKFDSSMDYFDKSLVQDPDNVEILSNKGSTLGKLGFYSEAIIYYDHALDIDPEFLPALNNKANSLANQGKYEEAKQLYEYAIEKNPNYHTARKNLSLLISEMPQERHVEYEPQPLITTSIDASYEAQSVKTKEPEPPKPTKSDSANFLEEVSLAFSSLGSLLGFLK